MKLTIDNLDGRGAVDYSATLDRSVPLTLERTLNAPSLAKGRLCLQGSGLGAPVRRARVSVSSDSGLLLFTGYLATEPVGIYAGVASEGAVYRLGFSAVSDEWLLDKQAAGAPTGVALGGTGASVLRTLANRLAPGKLSTVGLAGGSPLGVFEPEAGATWSGHAGAVASAGYAAYRALNGGLSLSPAGDVVHALSDGDGTLVVDALQTSSVRELANDVTVSGAMEPTIYWTELFSGDGTTAEFAFTGDPGAPNGGKATYLDDSFNREALDLQVWQVTDPGSHIGLSGGGLALTGGNGIDGQTTLASYDAIELGGTNVVELTGVTLGAASAGVVGGLYMGSTAQGNCFAGFNVRQSGGSTIVTPMINGVEAGTTLTLLSGHAYTLRLRCHCPEMLRVKQAYYAMVEGAVQTFGGGLVEAAAALVFEARDEGASSNTPMTVLYDGAVTSSPAQCNFVAANSIQLIGSIASVRVFRSGSAWVRSTNPTTGTVSTRLNGSAAEGVDCSVSSSSGSGKVTFWPGRIPLANEIVTVLYRGRERSVARIEDAASVAAEAAGGGVGTARWVGEVMRPVARSSEDCESAAQAILSFATDRAAAIAGSYTAMNLASSSSASADIWPGDMLALTTNGGVADVVVRKVVIEEQGASPETLTYRIAFANDWAQGIGLQLSEAIARDALIPETALSMECRDHGACESAAADGGCFRPGAHGRCRDCTSGGRRLRSAPAQRRFWDRDGQQRRRRPGASQPCARVLDSESSVFGDVLCAHVRRLRDTGVFKAVERDRDAPSAWLIAGKGSGHDGVRRAGIGGFEGPEMPDGTATGHRAAGPVAPPGIEGEQERARRATREGICRGIRDGADDHSLCDRLPERQTQLSNHNEPASKGVRGG